MIRGIVTSIVEGLIKRFYATGRTDETIDDREYFQHYGFTSRPKAGAELIIINEGNHYIAVASDDRRYRLALEDGEAAIYDDLGQIVHLTRTGIIVSSPLKITAAAPEIDVTATEKIVATAPEIVANAATSCQVNSPLINLGGDRETIRYLVDERIIALILAHTHGNGPAMNQGMTIADVCTTITKAG